MDDRTTHQRPGEQRPEEELPAWLEDLAHDKLAAETMARLAAASEAGQDAEHAQAVAADAQTPARTGLARLRLLQTGVLVTAAAGTGLYALATLAACLRGRWVGPLEIPLRRMDARLARLDVALVTAGAVAWRDRLAARMLRACTTVDRFLQAYAPPAPALRPAQLTEGRRIPAQRTTGRKGSTQ
ncbi:hypothetical protein AB0957_18305 [Streptomyces zhihengii]|uniref:hypothetical protein n=1 Tax=Streptomyces zhihengii TaxID=1818004 RepID=UPI0034520B7C